MEMKRKYLAGAVVDDATLGDRQIRVIVSTPDPDRVKDIMEPAGAELANFKLNPIFLADHNPKTPIGTIDVEVKSDRVEGVVTFAPLGVSAKADEYCGLFKAKILNTVSPGFRELEVEPLPGGGVRIKRWELLEVSGVAVPANPQAVVTARSFGAKADSNWKVGASRNLPIGEGDDWDGDAAAASIFDHAEFDGDDPDTTFARKGFLVYDAANPEDKGSYKLPFAHVVDGRLTAMPEGIRNAASRLPQTEIPDDVAEKARAVIDHYEGEMSSKDKSATAIKTKDAKKLKFKGLYDVAQLAYLLEQLGWIEDCAVWEADTEGDQSKVPAMLLDAMQSVGNALIAMTLEEVGELLGQDITVEMEKSLSPALGIKVKSLKSPIAKALAIARTKSGRKFSAATQKSMEDACKSILAGHDAIKAMFDDPDQDPNSDDESDDDEADTDTEKALTSGVLSERAREIELLRLKGC